MTFAKLLQSWWARLPQSKGGKLVVWSDCEDLLQAKQLQIPADDILDMYVPGRLRCPKCSFELSKATIFAQSGAIGASKAEVYQEAEPCPNDGTLMDRVTWREEADRNREYAEKLISEIIEATGTQSLPEAMEAIKTARAEALASAAVQPGTTLERSWEAFAEERSGMLSQAPLGFARQAFYAGAQTLCCAMDAAIESEASDEDAAVQLDALYKELVDAVEEMKL